MTETLHLIETLAGATRSAAVDNAPQFVWREKKTGKWTWTNQQPYREWVDGDRVFVVMPSGNIRFAEGRA